MPVWLGPSLVTWWRHQMETFSALLALFEGNPPIPGGSPHKVQWRGALVFSSSAPEQTVEQTIETLVIWKSYRAQKAMPSQVHNYTYIKHSSTKTKISKLPNMMSPPCCLPECEPKLICKNVWSGPLLLTLINWIQAWISNYVTNKVWGEFLSIPKLHQLHRWSFSINMKVHPTL